MYENLEMYLEEISHFLSGRSEREEILSEIRSHMLEKAERESGVLSEESLVKVIAVYGKPQQVAEKYLDGRAIIAPTFRRHLFRYTTLLFAIHFVCTVYAVLFQKSFILFPFLFMPRLGIMDAIMYLPTALLTDFGAVAALLYFITQSGKEVNLPWPRFALDLDEVQAPDSKALLRRVPIILGTVAMLAATAAAVTLFAKFQTVFFVTLDFEKLRPLLVADAGRRASLIVIAMLVIGTISLIIKIFATSRRVASWTDVGVDSVGLVLIAMLLRLPFANLFSVYIAPSLLPKIRIALTFLLLGIALIVAIDLVRKLIRLGRTYLAK